MRSEPVKMSEDELVRPHYLCNSTGQLVRVKQWLPLIRPRRTTSQNLDKNKDKCEEQSIFSSNQRTKGGKASSQSQRLISSSECDVMATKKDNLRRVANHQKSRVSPFNVNHSEYWPRGIPKLRHGRGYRVKDHS